MFPFLKGKFTHETNGFCVKEGTTRNILVKEPCPYCSIFTQEVMQV